jgi:hypothetical protein
MARTKPPTENKEAEALKARRELFCRYYTQSGDNFGNATLSYADAFEYDLEELSREPVCDPDTGKKIEDSPYDKQYHVCSVMSSRLLRNDEIQKRIIVRLNELLKDEIVDSELAKIISQDRDNPSKVAAIREFNELRGRIIDRTQLINRLPFGEMDLSTV